MNNLGTAVEKDLKNESIAHVLAYVAEHFADPITLADLAVVATIPENTLTRRFNRTFGLSPLRWVWYFRTVLASELIAALPETSLTEVALFCGFNSSAHFSRRFREVFALSPSKFRKTHRTLGGGLKRSFATRFDYGKTRENTGIVLVDNQEFFISRAMDKMSTMQHHQIGL